MLQRGKVCNGVSLVSKKISDILLDLIYGLKISIRSAEEMNNICRITRVTLILLFENMSLWEFLPPFFLVPSIPSGLSILNAKPYLWLMRTNILIARTIDSSNFDDYHQNLIQRENPKSYDQEYWTEYCWLLVSSTK